MNIDLWLFIVLNFIDSPVSMYLRMWDMLQFYAFQLETKLTHHNVKLIVCETHIFLNLEKHEIDDALDSKSLLKIVIHYVSEFCTYSLTIPNKTWDADSDACLHEADRVQFPVSTVSLTIMNS